jgi:histidinol dehydrogenase
MEMRPLRAAAVRAEVDALRPTGARSHEIAAAVAGIVEAVRDRGDEALVEATRRFDWPEATVDAVRVPAEDLVQAEAGMDSGLRAALETARTNCTFFHRHEMRAGWDAEGAQGQRLGIRYLPVARAGLYVPGGLGSYTSTVVMNTVPAQVAGVKELFICTPPGRDGSVNASVLAAAAFMGVHEVYRVGGAQAVAAMAFGTRTIRRADVICGPGNAYVNEAKRQVFGAVGIDSLAGPSEVVIVAGEEADPRWIAADLLAQEEHGSGAEAILVAASAGLCLRVRAALAQLRPFDPGTPRRLFAFHPAPGEEFLDAALHFVNEYAPEHLELHLADARAFAAGVTSAGAIFIGPWTPTAFGDYVAGSNHVLPTGGSARFSSPLGVDTFMRTSSLIELGPTAAAALAPPLARLATSEGFEFHRVSAELRGGAATES